MERGHDAEEFDCEEHGEGFIETCAVDLFAGGGVGRAEGQMVFLPVSDGGLLVYFGGVEDTYRNGSYNAVSQHRLYCCFRLTMIV